MTPELRSANTATRLVYCIALLSFLPASLLGSSGWIGVTLGRAGGGLVNQFVFLLIATAMGLRIYQVLRYRRALDAFVSNKFVATLRALCIAAMLVGGVLGLAVFFIRPLALFIFKTPGDSGIAFYIVGMFLALVAPLGWQACVAFEATRWIGNARHSGPRPDAPYRWKHDGIVAAVLMTLFFGGAILRSHFVKVDLEHACKEEDRIACVATVDERLSRMATLPIGSPVRLVSNISSIRMQMHNGVELKWEVVEGVANSLKVSGYEPSNEEALPVAVFVQATDAGAGPRLEVRVTESGDEVARMTAVFSSGARLEKDARGKLNLLAPLPPRSEGMIKVWRDDGGDDLTIDQLYVFFRRAIGTEVEALESKVRIADAPRSIKRLDGGGVQQPPLRETSNLVCDGHLEKNRVERCSLIRRNYPRLADDGAPPYRQRFPTANDLCASD